MPAVLRPLSLGKLLDETFNIYRRHFLLFVGISAIPYSILLLLQLVLATPAFAVKETRALALLAGASSYFFSQFVEALVTAATTFAVSDIYLEGPTSIVSSFARVAGKALRVFYVSLIVGLVVTVGLVLCIIPGIYWGGVYGLAIPVAVLENISGNKSIKRSAHLTRDSVERVVLVYFLTTTFAFAMGLALLEGETLLGLPSTAISREMLRLINGAFSNTFFGPITAIAITLVYYDLRVRKEAFDLDQMMALMAAPQNTAAATQSGGY